MKDKFMIKSNLLFAYEVECLLDNNEKGNATIIRVNGEIYWAIVEDITVEAIGNTLYRVFWIKCNWKYKIYPEVAYKIIKTINEQEIH